MLGVTNPAVAPANPALAPPNVAFAVANAIIELPNVAFAASNVASVLRKFALVLQNAAPVLPFAAFAFRFSLFALPFIASVLRFATFPATFAALRWWCLFSDRRTDPAHVHSVGEVIPALGALADKPTSGTHRMGNRKAVRILRINRAPKLEYQLGPLNQTNAKDRKNSE